MIKKIQAIVHKIPGSLSLCALLLLLGLWGCVAVLNATAYSGEPLRYMARQLCWLLLGGGVLVMAALAPFGWVRDNAWKLSLAAWLPLALVLLFGTRVNGMKGWFVWGDGATQMFFQPSELGKPAFVLGLCHLCVTMEGGPRKFLAMFGFLLLWLVPVALEPDYGTALVYAAAFCVVYWVGEGRAKPLALAAGLGAIGAAFVISRHSYVMDRLLGFLQPSGRLDGAAWHITQFHHAIARGGFWGDNLGKALWSHAYLPLSHSDSIFASLTESLGFVGAFPVIAGFAALVYCGYRLAFAPGVGRFAALFAFSVAALVAFQAFVHIAVNIGVMPPTGITLPLFSYGGSSMLSTMLSFGLMIGALGQSSPPSPGAAGESGLSKSSANEYRLPL